LKRAYTLSDEGKFQDAHNAMAQAEQAGADPEKVERLALRLALLEGKWREVTRQAAALQNRKAMFSGNLAFRVYEAYCAEARWAEAYAFLRDITVPADERGLLIRPLYNSLLSCTEPQDCPKHLEEMVFGPEGGPEHTVAFDIWAMQVGTENEAIANLVQRAHDTWPDNPIVAKNLSRRRVSAPKDAAQEDLDDISYLRLSARSLKMRAPEDPLAEISDSIVEAQISKGLKRPLLRDDASDFIASPEGSSGTTVLVFGGLGGLAVITYAMLDSYFAARDVTGLYIRDSSRLLTLNGIPKVGDTLEKTVVALKQRLAALTHHKHLVVLGSSGGGLGALQYGARLNAKAIHLMSPATNIEHGFLRRIADTRAPALQARLGDQIQTDAQDAREVLLRAPSTQVHIHYPASNPTDSAHAEHLGDLPNVHLHPRPGLNGHNILPDMFAKGDYQAMIEEICATGQTSKA
jgi:pimeloyl-ACP methyl ester carboxylesterase